MLIKSFLPPKYQSCSALEMSSEMHAWRISRSVVWLYWLTYPVIQLLHNYVVNVACIQASVPYIPISANSSIYLNYPIHQQQFGLLFDGSHETTFTIYTHISIMNFFKRCLLAIFQKVVIKCKDCPQSFINLYFCLRLHRFILLSVDIYLVTGLTLSQIADVKLHKNVIISCM